MRQPKTWGQLSERVRFMAPKAKRKSGIDAAKLESLGNAVNGQHVSRDTVVDLMCLSVANDFVEGTVHHVVEAFVDFAFAPEETLTILNPFEIADGDAAGVAEDIRDSEDALGINDGVGLPGSGTVGTFTENLALNLVGVLFGNLIFDGGGNEYVAGLEENVARAHFRTAAGKVLQRLFLIVNPFDNFGNVEAFFVVETTTDVREADDFVAGLVHEFGGERTDI